MRKEYTKVTTQIFNENMEATTEINETILTSLIPDNGKLIREKSTGITGTRVDLGSNDSEENYEEVNDPRYV